MRLLVHNIVFTGNSCLLLLMDRSHLELISELPWEAPKPSAHLIDVAKARQILDDVSRLFFFFFRKISCLASGLTFRCVLVAMCGHIRKARSASAIR